MKNNFILFCSAFVVILNISCLKKQNLEDQNLGPAVTANDVQQKMGEAIGTLNFGDIKVGEFKTASKRISRNNNSQIHRSRAY